MTQFNIYVLAVAMLLLLTGLYLLVKTRNMIRIIIAIEIVMKAVTLVLIFAGSVNGNMVVAQTFVVTIIVCEVVVAVVAAGIAINIFRHHGDLDVSRLNKLNG